MLCARYATRRYSPLTADFLRFYNLDFNEVFNNDRELAYVLAGNLPQDSAARVDAYGGDNFSHSDLMLTIIEYYINMWLTANSDGNTREPELKLPEHIKHKMLSAEEQINVQQTPEEIRAYIYGDFS